MNKFRSCSTCQKVMAKTRVNKCVHCEKRHRKFFMKHKIITIILFSLAILTGVGAALNNHKNQSSKVAKVKTSNINTRSTSINTSSISTSSTSIKSESKKYSFDKFMQIKMGMTYDQVKSILGNGQEVCYSDDGNAKAIIYSWQNSDKSNIRVALQDNKVINKSQAFLKSMDAKVTIDKYNKVSNGMTYDQVKSTLGEGQLISQTKIPTGSSDVYEWINGDGSNMNVIFQGGKVNGKSQFKKK